MKPFDPPLPRLSDYAHFHAHLTPDADALVLGDVVISYAALAEAVDRLARALLAAGVQKGDRVATLQTPCPDYFVALLATASIGAIWVGLNPRHGVEELGYVIGDARPKILLARRRTGDRDFSADLAAIMESSDALQHLVVYDDEPMREAVAMQDFLSSGREVSERALQEARDGCGGTDPCLIVYTSGSTGQPKGALLHHAGIIGFACQQNVVWPVIPLRVLNFLPISHIGCVIDVSAPALIAGGTIVFQEGFDAALSLRLMEDHAVTLWGSVPSVFALQLVEPTLAERDLSAVQLIVWEGAAASQDLVARLLEFGVPLATNYGLTEAGSGGTILPPTRDPDRLSGVGGAFPGVDIRLAGNDDAGEIELRSPYLMQGYWQRPEATAAAFTDDGYLRTGDLAVRRDDGDYAIVGRTTEMYKSGGYNIYPLEIEAVVGTCPGVGQVAVVARSDALWQEVGVAFVTLLEGATLAEVETWCRARLANYKRPKHFVALDTLPLLPIGKVDRSALKRRAATLGPGESV